jgi:hypothetical protein
LHCSIFLQHKFWCVEICIKHSLWCLKTSKVVKFYWYVQPKQQLTPLSTPKSLAAWFHLPQVFASSADNVTRRIQQECDFCKHSMSTATRNVK